MQKLNQIEIAILDWIRNNLSCNFLDKTMIMITRLGNNGLFFILLVMILFFIPKTRKFATTFSLAMILEFLSIDIILKPLVGRARPFVFNDGADLIIPALNSASFPSGHTGLAFAFALSLLVYGKKGVTFGLVFAILMGFSRMYLYVHYPTDVIFGAIIGSLCGYFAYKITKKIFK
ncbi:MAG: phosphatase PAP2 family protein [Acutalibacteraceae bacterium]|jgi:undecaprenyl-diphosphatase